MKKILILLGLAAFTSSAALAACEKTFGCSAPYDLTPKTSRVMSTVTGSNFLGRKIVEKILEKEIKKSSGADLNVKLDTYSVTDLKNGRFKSVEITGKNVLIDGVAVSELDLKTLCDFNYIVYDKTNNTITFKEDFAMSFSAVLSEDDLNKTMQAAGYHDLITQINKLGKTYNLLDIVSSGVRIQNNKFIYITKVALPFMRGTSDIKVTTDLCVKDGEICFNNPKIHNDFFSFNSNKLAYALNYLNPLEFSLRILENKHTDLKVQNLSIINNKVVINGTITVSKDTVTQK